VQNFITKYKKDFRLNLKLALPLMASQLGQVIVNFVDNIMVAKLGPAALAGVSFANALYAICLVFGMGISFALPPLISEAQGAADDRRISSYFKHSLIVNLAFGVISMILLIAFIPFMKYLGQDPEIIPHAADYMYYSALGMIPFMIFQTLRCYSDGLSETLPSMIIIILGNLLNVILNYLLIFGHWGLPEMGTAGAALSSLISRVFMVFGILIIFRHWKNLWIYLSEVRFNMYKSSYFKKILSLGIPSSFQMTFELTAFSAAAIIMGFIGKIEQASHQIAINLASITFMIATGLAMASTIRVGNQLGKGDISKVKDAGYSAMIQITIFMIVAAIGFVLARHLLPTIYMDNAEVISIAAYLLLAAAIFQIPDGIQVITLSALRGLQDVKVPTFITFLSYWLLGIPCSYILAITLEWGPIGVWIGLILGLTISAIFLSYRFKMLTDKLAKKQ
jgi:MATE family multidrug resistance protein|tara:strand:+ start:4523 stop:5875 length:1353 start_codon:yes stop_codon:yes gene_type:complete